MSDKVRICSLLPSATEIVFALGLEEQLVGVTHECDFPAGARTKPKVTSSVIDSENLTAAEIDQAVRESLESEETIYYLDAARLEELQPDLILTQNLCTVCAVGSGTVTSVVDSLSRRPEVISLEPQTLAGVLDSILGVGRVTGTLRRAIHVTDDLRRRLQVVQEAVASSETVSVLTIEWVDPLFVGGHWVPEMVNLAGGRDVLGTAGQPSRQVAWQEAMATDPDLIIAMPCGFGLERSVSEVGEGTLPAEWESLRAVREEKVFAVDGSSYFNRPGPRLVDGVEILAGILHPEEFPKTLPGSFARILSARMDTTVTNGN